jgi:hypothetical protein
MKAVVARLLDQPDELDDPLNFLFVRFPLGPVRLIVGIPVCSLVFEFADTLGLQQQSLVGSKMISQK